MRTNDLLFGGEPHSRTTNVGLLILRVFAGLALALAHGMGKIPPSEGFIGMIGGMGFPAPALFAWLAAIAEFGGGLLIAIGLLTRPAAVFVAAHFVIVSFVVHAGDTFGDRELALFFLVTAIFLALAGAGRYSADAAIRGRGASERTAPRR
jgi:putative oxidoreductase